MMKAFEWTNFDWAGMGAALIDAVVSIKKAAIKARKEHSRLILVTGSVIGGYVAVKAAILAFSIGKQITVHSKFSSLEKGIVHLFAYHRWSHGPNYFLHCLKVETFLRLAKIPYAIHFTSDASMSPSGRLPFILHNDTVLGDSEFIIQYLKEEFKVTIDDRLTQEEHAIGLLTRRMAETSLNYGLQRTMMVDRPELMQDMFSKEYLLEPVFAQMLISRMRTTLIKVLDTVGYGHLEQEQYTNEFLREVESLETLLRNRKFLLGDAPTTYDCSVYGWLQIAGEMGPHGPGLAYLAGSKILRDYITRMSAMAFPDMDKLIVTDESQKYIPVV